MSNSAWKDKVVDENGTGRLEYDLVSGRDDGFPKYIMRSNELRTIFDDYRAENDTYFKLTNNYRAHFGSEHDVYVSKKFIEAAQQAGGPAQGGYPWNKSRLDDVASSSLVSYPGQGSKDLD
jgi:hypothetical protein